jgi:hypothetical protein
MKGGKLAGKTAIPIDFIGDLRRSETAELKNCPQDNAAARLPLTFGCGICLSVKTVDFSAVKRQEARSRMAAARKARRSPRAAAELQQRASLVGNGAKWRITNFKQVARAMSRWA